MNSHVLTGAIPASREADRIAVTEITQTSARRLVANILFIVAALVVTGMAVWHLLNPLTLPIHHVRVEGNFQHLSEQKMKSIVTAVIKGGFFNLNVMKIKEELQSEPWVDWVVVQRVWPDGLNVHINEQVALAHWNRDSLLNSESRIFSPQFAASLRGIPHFFGPDNSEVIVHQRYRQISLALEPSVVIDELHLSERRAWQLKVRNGPLVVLGRNDLDARISRFIDVVVPGLGDDLHRAERIDLRYTNGFAIQWLEDGQKLTDSGPDENA